MTLAVSLSERRPVAGCSGLRKRTSTWPSGQSEGHWSGAHRGPGAARRWVARAAVFGRGEAGLAQVRRGGPASGGPSTRGKACSALMPSNGSGREPVRVKACGCRASCARRDLPERVCAAGKPHLAELLNRTEESSIVDSVVNFEFNTVSISNSDGFEIATSIGGPELCGLAGMTGCLRGNRPPTRCCGLHDTGLRLA